MRARTPVNPFVEKGDAIEVVPSPLSPPRRERITSPSGSSLSGKQRIPRLRARVTIKMTEEFMEGARKIIKRK